jgi:hypothetical protein
MRTLILTALLAVASLVFAQERTAAPAGAEAYIISPQDGAKVHSPVRVEFGLKGMGVAPAGVKFDNTGHHHLLVDTDAPADLTRRCRRRTRSCTSARDRPRPAHHTPASTPAAAARGSEPHTARPAAALQEDHHPGREVIRQRPPPRVPR